MRTDHTFAHLHLGGLALACLLIPHFSFADGPSQPVSKQEVSKLLPRGVDMLDPTEVADYSRLVNLGDRAYPALVELLVEEQNYIIISRILGVFVESKGDKTAPIQAIRNLLRTNAHWRTSVKMKLVAADVLSKIGDHSDCESLYPLVADDNERVRIVSLRGIAKLGDEECAIRVEAILAPRREQLGPTEAKRDATIDEGQKCVRTLRAKKGTDGSTPEQ